MKYLAIMLISLNIWANYQQEVDSVVKNTVSNKEKVELLLTIEKKLKDDLSYLQKELSKLQNKSSTQVVNEERTFESILADKNISDELKGKELQSIYLSLDKKKQAIASKNIQKLLQPFISQAKKDAAITMKEKGVTDEKILEAWVKFAQLAQFTQFEKDGKKLVQKYSANVFKKLSKEFEVEEKKEGIDKAKISLIIENILKLDIPQKQKDIYLSKQPLYKVEEAKVEKTEVKIGHKTEIKEEVKKEEFVKIHPLLNKNLEAFRAPTHNKNLCKLGIVDSNAYVGSEATESKKLLVVSFFANYCKPCKKELPFLNKLYEKYKDKGLLILAVNTDSDKEEINNVIQFINDNKLSFPVLKDSYNLIAQRYQIELFPSMFLIDSTGKIVDVTIGYDSNEEKLENKIADFLK